MSTIKKQILYMIFIFLCGFSCTQKGNDKDASLDYILPTDSLSVFLGIPVYSEFFDNKLFVFDIFGEDGFVKVIDMQKDSTLFSIAKRGSGPNEYLHVSNIDIYKERDSVFVALLDPVQKKYYKYLYEDLMTMQDKTLPNKKIDVETGVLLTNMLNVSPSCFLASGLTEKGKFISLDKDLKEIGVYGKYRPKPNSSIPDIVHARANLGKIFISPDKKTIGSIINNAGVLEVYKINDNIPYLSNEYIIDDIDYKMDGSNILNEKIGYLSGTMSDRFIYVLYSGEKEDRNSDAIATYGHEVHIFNYDGDLLKKIDIQRSAFDISIDGDNNILYVVSHVPESTIYIYKLDELVEH